MHAERDPAQRRGERDVGGGGVDGIATDNDESVDLSGSHVGDEIAQRLNLIDRFGLDRIGVDDRPSHVAERLVHRVGQGMHRRRQAVARDDEARSAMRQEIFATAWIHFWCAGLKSCAT